MSNDETNPFGGKNPAGLYVPMSEDEQEVLQRLVENKDLKLIIHGVAVVDDVNPIFGDLRVSIPIHLEFTSPPVPKPLYYLDLELTTQAGIRLVKERLPTAYNGRPLQACRGVVVDMVWDIAIDHMDPNLVKMLKPGAKGLTSRRLDRDTGEATLEGNMDLDPTQRKILHIMQGDKDKVRKGDTEDKVKATRAAGEGVRMTDKGPEAADPE